MNTRVSQETEALTKLKTQYEQDLDARSKEIEKLKEENVRMKAEHEQALKRCEATSAKNAQDFIQAKGKIEFLEKAVALCD